MWVVPSGKFCFGRAFGAGGQIGGVPILGEEACVSCVLVKGWAGTLVRWELQEIPASSIFSGLVVLTTYLASSRTDFWFSVSPASKAGFVLLLISCMVTNSPCAVSKTCRSLVNCRLKVAASCLLWHSQHSSPVVHGPSLSVCSSHIVKHDGRTF